MPTSRHLALSALTWFTSYYTMALLGGVVAFLRLPRYPNTDHPHPIPDLVFDFILTTPYCPKILNMNIQSLVLALYYAYIAFGIMPHHKNARLIIARILLISSLIFLTRTTTVSITSFPQPNPTPKCVSAQNNLNPTVSDAFRAVLGTFPPKACGDLIYSGHMACTITTCIIFTKEKCFHNSKALQVSQAQAREQRKTNGR